VKPAPVLAFSPFGVHGHANYDTTNHQEQQMGKGDRKTAKGKRYNSSYGNARSHVTAKASGSAAAPVAKKAAARTVAKAPAKKVVAKKTVAKD